MHQGWTAIVLAGERPGGDPLARHFGVTRKALIPIVGRTMLRRVCDALLATPGIARIVILAQDPQPLLTGDTSDLADDPRVSLAAGGNGIATSIAAIAGSAQAPYPLLVTTADHPLLTREILEAFLGQIGDNDLAVGVGERTTLEASYPDNRRTWLKFSDGHYSGANLFALRNERVGPALALWSSVEQDRKKARKIFARFGPWLMLRALTRTIGFGAAIAKAGKRLGLTAEPVVIPIAEAAIDVDKPSDYDLVEAILRRREGGPA